jgi:hypothetical protein
MSQNRFDDDEILGKAYDGRLMRRLAEFIKPYWRLMAGRSRAASRPGCCRSSGCICWP